LSLSKEDAVKFVPNYFVLALILLLMVLASEVSLGDLSYWKFITHNMVLNVGLATIAIAVGYFVKNYLLLILGASFSLAIFCLALIFSPGGLMLSQFFLAIYTVFLGFSAVANLCRHYKDWVLVQA